MVSFFVGHNTTLSGKTMSHPDDLGINQQVVRMKRSGIRGSVCSKNCPGFHCISSGLRLLSPIILLLTFPGLLLLGFLVDKQKFDKLLISLVPFLSLSFYAILFFVYSKMAIPFRLQTVLISFCVVLVFYLLFKYRQLGFVLQSLKNSSFHFSKDWI